MNEISGINVDPAGAKNNTIDSSYPNGKWEIKHDDTKIADDDLQNGMGVRAKIAFVKNVIRICFCTGVVYLYTFPVGT